jgi:hypothetical protein
MASKAKRQEARAKHQRQKRRARVSRILNKYRGDMFWADSSSEEFQSLVKELYNLNVKYLEQFFNDLKSNPGYVDNNKALRDRVETMILEKTVLK